MATQETPADNKLPVEGGIDESLCANLLTLSIAKVDCADCQEPLEVVLSQRPEIIKHHVDLSKGQLTLALQAGSKYDEKVIKQDLARAGYRLVSIKKGCF